MRKTTALSFYIASNAGTVGDYIRRAINVVLGWIGLGLHKAETPEVLAQRLMDDQLAELSASFKVGDHKGDEDAFNRAADEAIAEGKGKLDAAQSSPEEQLKEIERSARHDGAEDSFNARLKKLEQQQDSMGHGA